MGAQTQSYWPSAPSLVACGMIITAAVLAQCHSGQPLSPQPKATNASSGFVAEPATKPADRASPQPTKSSLPATEVRPEVAVQPEPVGKVVVALLGDSLTDEKVGGGGYVKLLRKKCPESRFDNFGKGADMVNQMLRRFLKDVYPGGQERTAYTHVVVFGGVNDLYSDLTAGRTPAKIQRDLAVVYDTAKKHGAKVVGITVTPWGGFSKYYNARRGAATRRLNDWIAEQETTGRLDAVIDGYKLLSCGNPEMLCPSYRHAIGDGLHFGKKGHERIAQALLETAFLGCR